MTYSPPSLTCGYIGPAVSLNFTLAATRPKVFNYYGGPSASLLCCNLKSYLFYYM